MPYCPKCGKEVQADAEFCVNCGTSLKAAAAPSRTEPTRPTNFADLGSRIIAGLIDYIIVAIIAFILNTIVFASLFMLTWPWGGAMPEFRWNWFGGMFGIQFLLWLVYFTYFEGTSGQTIGKKVANISVVKDDGSKCEFGSALIRNILRIIDHLPFLYILGIILIAATSQRQRLGDMLAKTIVVKK